MTASIAQLEKMVKKLEAQRDQLKEELETLRLFIEEESKRGKDLSAAKVFDRAQRERGLLLGAIGRACKALEAAKPPRDVLTILYDATAKVENRRT